MKEDNSNKTIPEPDVESLPFFDDTPGLSPEETEAMEKSAREEKSSRSRKRRGKKRRQRKDRDRKVAGVWILPVYRHTYLTIKECMFRFRNVPRRSANITRETINKLVHVAVMLEAAHWCLIPKERLMDVYMEMLEALLFIRALRDLGEISTHEFACISEHSGEMAKHMLAWSKSYNKSFTPDPEIPSNLQTATTPSGDRNEEKQKKQDSEMS